MPGLCTVARWVPEDLGVPRPVRTHRARCLRCQADAVRVRGLLRDLSSLRDEVLAAPPGLHTAVMSSLDRRHAEAGRSRLRAAVATAAGAVVVVAAAVGGGLVLRRQRTAG